MNKNESTGIGLSRCTKQGGYRCTIIEAKDSDKLLGFHIVSCIETPDFFLVHQFFLVLLVFHQPCCPQGGGGPATGVWPQGGGGLGRGHFHPAAINCTTTWCFALKGLRTIKTKGNTNDLFNLAMQFVTGSTEHFPHQAVQSYK